MNAWDFAGQLLGWIIVALLSVVALGIALLIVGGIVLVLVSIWQSIRSGRPVRLRRSKRVSDVPMPTGPTPPGGAQ